MQCEGIGLPLVPIWPVKNLIEKSFVHGWLGKEIQASHPVILMAIAPLFRQICCGCAVHTVLLHRTAAGTQPSPGSLTRSAVFNLLQPFVIPKMHVKMQKCSFHSHQLLTAIIKRDMQAQERWAWPQQHWGLLLLPAEQKIVSQLEVPFCLTRGGWTSLSIRNVSCAYLSSQDLPQQVGSPRAGESTAVQVMQQPHSLRLLQWNLSNTDRRTKAHQGTHLG